MLSHRTALASGIFGAALLSLAWTAALPEKISGAEESLFRAINDLPDWIEYPTWPVMQTGSLLAVPLVAAVCILVLRDWRVPGRVLVAGGGAWLAARLIKAIADRGRPDAFFDDINLRPVAEGLGFVSGHASVAVAMAVVLAPALSPRLRRIAWAVALTAGLLRVYVGAHLPLDVLGGWGLGLVIGSLAGAVPLPPPADPEGVTRIRAGRAAAAERERARPPR